MKIYDKTKHLLETYPPLRNGDKLLIWAVWKEEGLANSHYITLENFLKATSAESVRRTRQKIQELHPELSPTSETVRRRRGLKEASKGTFIFREEQ